MSRSKGDVEAWIKTRLRPGDVAIDVGAWGGHETRIMADRVGSAGRVYAIEPMPDPALDAITKTHPQVSVLQALAGALGGPELFYPGAKGQSSRFRGLVPDPGDLREIPMITLDSLHLSCVALVKLDVQGSEHDVLHGATELLQTCPYWIVELWPHGLHVAGTSAAILVQRLRAAGLTVRWGEGDVMADENLIGWLAHCKDASHVNLLAERA